MYRISLSFSLQKDVRHCLVALTGGNGPPPALGRQFVAEMGRSMFSSSGVLRKLAPVMSSSGMKSLGSTSVGGEDRDGGGFYDSLRSALGCIIGAAALFPPADQQSEHWELLHLVL